MTIIRAKTAGFCMGVSLALHTLDKALDDFEHPATATEADALPGAAKRIVTYGPIIHNPEVLSGYALRGVVCVESPQEISSADIVVIRAHGIPQEDEHALKERGAYIRDATCPKVKRAQLSISEATGAGRVLLLFGEEDHPEVKGLISYARHGVHVFNSLEELETHTLSPEDTYVLAAQTTQDQTEFARIATWVERKFTGTPMLRTICNATRKRQNEALAIAHTVDAMVVVGGKTSGNTRRLAALSEECGIRTWHIEHPSELPAEDLSGLGRIGLTAGASTPCSQIDRVHTFLEKIEPPE